jgi:glycosyltransferase involved in cell wall biosynthesis
VFEQAVGLRDRGFDVEIWSLEEQPTWVDLAIAVKRFRSYYDMLFALRNEEAIKVATWWETAQVVWLASVNDGVPVNFVQEFETWFYPGEADTRAAVVSSYRREFTTLTTADFQREELLGIRVEAELIPAGYEEKWYHPLPGVARKPDSMLVIGRSFFQKNFQMTKDAWTSLGERRPELVVFGFEPDLVTDDRATFVPSPSNERVNELYNEATMFVQTSRHEGFALPIIEAMAAGCPVITTDCHGNRGFCTDEENCLMVAQDDVGGLAAAIERLRDDPELQDRLRRAGLVTAERYRWSFLMDRVADFYGSVA